MITIYHCEQGSAEWFAVRLGLPTASEFGPVMAKGEGKTRRTYMMKLLAERVTGDPTETYKNAHIVRGNEMEPDARRYYALMTDTEPEQIGFIRNDRAGASPDSLIGDSGLLEIKTKLPYLQLEVVLAEKVPPEHIPQIQGQLWVSEREWCDLVVYWPRCPPFIKRVHRDEKYIKNLADEVLRFADELDGLTEKLKAQGVTLAK